MVTIKFFERALDSDLQYAVVVARYNGKFIFCRHAGRETWELPGGVRAAGESIRRTAERVLLEQTGAAELQLEPVSAYGVASDGKEETFGALYFAEIDEMKDHPGDSSIEELQFSAKMPEAKTCPQLHPSLMRCVENWLAEGNFHSWQDDLFDLIV